MILSAQKPAGDSSSNDLNFFQCENYGNSNTIQLDTVTYVVHACHLVVFSCATDATRLQASGGARS